jgi:hypothetical protein
MERSCGKAASDHDSESGFAAGALGVFASSRETEIGTTLLTLQTI